MIWIAGGVIVVGSIVALALCKAAGTSEHGPRGSDCEGYDDR
jgi:hypothetical protein